MQILESGSFQSANVIAFLEVSLDGITVGCDIPELVHGELMVSNEHATAFWHDWNVAPRERP